MPDHQHGGTDAPECTTCEPKLTEARAQVVACQTAADEAKHQAGLDVGNAYRTGYGDGWHNMAHRVEAAIAPWPPGVRKGDVLRAIGGVE